MGKYDGLAPAAPCNRCLDFIQAFDKPASFLEFDLASRCTQWHIACFDRARISGPGAPSAMANFGQATTGLLGVNA
jgi:hypothetical protein